MPRESKEQNNPVAQANLDLKSRFYGKERQEIVYLTLFCIVSACIVGIYFYNIVNWGMGPNFGWSTSNELGKTVLVEVYGTAELAGLQKGDVIVTVNSATIETYAKLQNALNRKPGQVNLYGIKRNDQFLNVAVPNEHLGVGNAFVRFGFTWSLGIVLFIMGGVVFFMKPGRPSMAFMLFMFASGLYITFLFTSKLTPDLLRNVFIAASAFLPATVLHVAQTFPVERPWYRKHNLSIYLPYVFSLLLFVIMQMNAKLYVDINPVLKKMAGLYIASSLLIFLGTTFYSFFYSQTDIVRIRSKIILIGCAAAFIMPVANLLTMILFKKMLLPNPVFNLPFFIFFPLSIGYSIARHNLFDVDVYIKRAVGYGLMTVVVGSVYFVIQLGVKSVLLQPILGSYAENVYPVIFALLVVFFFNPINRLVQGVIDKLFFRKDFDYKTTIQSMSNMLSSVLHLDEAVNRIIQTVRQEMFIDNAGIVLLGAGGTAGKSFFVYENENGVDERVEEETLAGDPLLALMQNEKKMITKFDIAEDPQYADMKVSCGMRFEEIDSSLVIPLLYKDEVQGALALGQKKSGKFYSREDIDLLETLANQSAIAIENARLFEENMEKTRMEEELKIAHDIQISMLPEFAPEIEGYSIAASSFPAREVGGDFYDFIEIGEENDKKLGIIVGDVSGKAVSGALVMAASRSIFRVLANPDIAVSEMMLRGNRRLKYDVKQGMFVALVYAMLAPLEKKMTIVNAGQTQPIHCSISSAKPVYIDTEGDRFPLGIIEDCEYLETVVSLEQGDTVVFYTDGIVEAMNEAGDMYGFDHFLDVIEENKSLEADEFLRNLMADVTRFVGDAEQHDDLTIVAVKVH